MNDPYATLGLSPNASLDECKTAFRNLAKTCHPDLHPDDPSAEARFKDLNTAYNAILNPPEDPVIPETTWNFFRQNHAARSPFDDLFTHIRRAMVQEMRISLEDAFHGKDITLHVSGREIKTQIPAGVEDGMRLILPKSGTPPNNNDVQVLVRVVAHHRFTRLGPNLAIMVPVTAFDVLLGNDIEVEGIDGHTIRVAIPTNFDSSRKLRLAGQGMPINGTVSRGDLLVTLFVQYPVIPAHHLETLRSIAKDLNF